jgi:flagellar biosynthetic protein FliR
VLDIAFSQYELETFFLILVRITSFIYIAPFFGQANTPQRIKLGFALFLSFLVYMVLPKQTFDYSTTLEYAVLILKEAVTGSLIAFGAFLCMNIVQFAGHIVDMEIGLTMATTFDPSTNSQVTISGQLYQNLFMMLFIVSGMHWYFISALTDSFTAIPLDGIHVRVQLLDTFIECISNYFIIGFRIALPVFASSLMANILLGIMTKVAPQIHMFSIGMQLKIIAGLAIMFMTITALPNIASYLFEQMKEMTVLVVRYLSP